MQYALLCKNRKKKLLFIHTTNMLSHLVASSYQRYLNLIEHEYKIWTDARLKLCLRSRDTDYHHSLDATVQPLLENSRSYMYLKLLSHLKNHQ